MEGTQADHGERSQAAWVVECPLKVSLHERATFSCVRLDKITEKIHYQTVCPMRDSSRMRASAQAAPTQGRHMLARFAALLSVALALGLPVHAARAGDPFVPSWIKNDPSAKSVTI